MLQSQFINDHALQRMHHSKLKFTTTVNYTIIPDRRSLQNFNITKASMQFNSLHSILPNKASKSCIIWTIQKPKEHQGTCVHCKENQDEKITHCAQKKK